MNATETGKLLAFAALYDNRKVSDPDVIAWLKAIGDLPYADAEAAVAAHYGTTTERIMPGHIRQGVRRIREERLARTPLPPPPPELADDPARYKRAIAEGVSRIADGFGLHRAIGGPLPGDPPAGWQQAKQAVTPEPVSRQELARQQAEQSRRDRERAGREARHGEEAS